MKPTACTTTSYLQTPDVSKGSLWSKNLGHKVNPLSLPAHASNGKHNERREGRAKPGWTLRTPEIPYPVSGTPHSQTMICPSMAHSRQFLEGHRIYFQKVLDFMWPQMEKNIYPLPQFQSFSFGGNKRWWFVSELVPFLRELTTAFPWGYPRTLGSQIRSLKLLNEPSLHSKWDERNCVTILKD